MAYLAIILYILSVVAGIIALVAGKHVSKGNFLFGVLLHVLFIILFIVQCISMNKGADHAPVFQLSFLFTICSGLILCGVAWKTNAYVIIKIYFSLFSITLLMFLYSPSRMINFLLSARYADTMGKIFHVGENYFLEEQTSAMDNDARHHYKLVRKHGLYYQTIQRDILFDGNLDSIHVLEFSPEQQTASIRGYIGKVTYVSTEIDSTDVTLKLKPDKKNQIERKL